MNKNRLPIILIAASLILAFILAIRDVHTTISASGNSNARIVGYGDLRLFESQQSLRQPNNTNPASGFGDLRVYEEQQSLAIPNTASRYVGFGDFRTFESQQNSLTSSSRYVGFGDLRVIENQQSQPANK